MEIYNSVVLIYSENAEIHLKKIPQIFCYPSHQ